MTLAVWYWESALNLPARDSTGIALLIFFWCLSDIMLGTRYSRRMAFKFPESVQILSWLPGAPLCPGTQNRLISLAVASRCKAPAHTWTRDFFVLAEQIAFPRQSFLAHFGFSGRYILLYTFYPYKKPASPVGNLLVHSLTVPWLEL